MSAWFEDIFKENT